MVLILLLGGSMICVAQADRNSPFGAKPEDDRPLSIIESLEKSRIERAKKDHAQMIERGQEAFKLSEQLERAFEQNGRLTEREFVKVAEVEKIVKKIRSELGGDGDGEDDIKSESIFPSPGEAVKTLRSAVGTLYAELKKTTRFTISAAAIQTSNAVIKLSRILRITK